MRHTIPKRTRYLPTDVQGQVLPELLPGFWSSVFHHLYEFWGDPWWWPGENAWEVAVGAILTQNTNWNNVERALQSLSAASLVTPAAVRKTDLAILGTLIRSSGYYNAKSKKIHILSKWWMENVDTLVTVSQSTDTIRNQLLSLWGIGPETADSILCYAIGRPVFVVDAYTKRIVTRMKKLDKDPAYETLQEDVHKELPRHTLLYNYLHGLLVVLAKEHCRSSRPNCHNCPLASICATAADQAGQNENRISDITDFL